MSLTHTESTLTPNIQFDINATVSVEVTINDDSIFNDQTAFRRAELLPASNDGNDDSTVGIKSIHFSVMKSDARPLNLSHEYQLAFLETADFSANQFVLKTGTILGMEDAGLDPDTLFIFGNTNQNQLLFSTPFTAGVFHNFALTLDFDALYVPSLHPFHPSQFSQEQKRSSSRGKKTY